MRTYIDWTDVELRTCIDEVLISSVQIPALHMYIYIYDVYVYVRTIVSPIYVCVCVVCLLLHLTAGREEDIRK